MTQPIETPQGQHVATDIADVVNQVFGPTVPFGNVQQSIQWDRLIYAFARVVDKVILAPGVNLAQVLQLITQKAAEVIAAVTTDTKAALQADVDTTNARAAEIQQSLAQDFDALSRQISGGAPINFEVLIPPLVRIADVIISNEDRFEPFLRELIDRLIPALGSIAGAGSAPAAAIRQDLVAAIAGLQLQLASGSPPDLAASIKGVVDDLLLHNALASQEFLQAGVVDPRAIITLVGKWLPTLFMTGAAVNYLSDQKLTEALPETAQKVLGLGGRVLVGVAESTVRGIAGSHQAMRGVMGTLAGAFFDEIDGELATLGQSDPESVLPKARELLTLAASLGSTAHLFAIAAEALHGSKHLGLNLFGAFLTDLAGFENIAKHSFGVQYETALREPAQRRAAKRFRPSLPDHASVVQQWYENRISDNDLRQWYAEHGWDDFWIEGQLQALPIEASPRDLALVFEDSGADLDWAIGHLTQRGFQREDAERIAQGVQTRATKAARQAAVTAVLNAYEAGLLDAGGVTQRLRPLRLSDQAIETLILGSDVDRLRRERQDLRTELLAQAALGQVTDADVSASLAAFGYDERAQHHTAALARLRAARRVFQETAADTKAATRRAQSEAITAAQEAFRRGLLTEGQLAETLRAHGVNEVEIDDLVALARVRSLPVPKLAEVLSPEAQAQRLLEFEIDRVLTLVRRGVVDEATGQASLLGLGVSQDEAVRRVRLAAAAVAKPPDRFIPRTINDVEEEARRIKMQAAREAFRAGVIDLNTLSVRLREAGVEPQVIAAVTQFEQTKRTSDVRREFVNDAERLADQRRRAQQRAAVEAFRAGTVDDAGLLANLLAIGLDHAIAEAIVTSERQQRDFDEAQRTRSAREREETEDQRLRTDAVLFGLRHGVVDEAQARRLLADAGVSESRVELLIAREQARRPGARTSGA